MTTPEREAFLAGVHVGVLGVDDPGHGPLTVPVWYSYEPGGTVDVITGGAERQGALPAGRRPLLPVRADRDAALQLCQRGGPHHGRGSTR